MSKLPLPARWALLIAAGFLVVGIYYYVAPTNFMGKDGGLFGCGSPMSPNTGSLGKGQCNIMEDAAAYKAYLFFGLALVTAALGYLMFNHPTTAGRPVGEGRYRRDDLDDDGEPLASRGSRRAAREDDVARRHAVDEDAPRRRRLGDEDFETDVTERRD